MRDFGRYQTTHAGRGIEFRVAPQASVDDHANAIDGQAGFRDGGRQHDFALSSQRGCQGGILRGACEFAVQWHHAHRRVEARSFQGALHPTDLGGAGEEAKNIAGMFLEGAAQDLRHLQLKMRLRAAWQVVSSHLEAAAARGNDGRVIQQLGERQQIECRGHDDNT